MIYSTQYENPDFCRITLASDGDSIIGLWLEGQKYFSRTVDEPMTPSDDLPVLLQACEWLDRYFAGETPQPSELPLAPRGSEFARRVWQILAEIPYGSLRTYGDIATQIGNEVGKRMSAQAIGGAVGHNPISIIIPCHRVVGKNGSLTGYAGGVDKKIYLLTHEGIDMNKLFVPKKGTAL